MYNIQILNNQFSLFFSEINLSATNGLHHRDQHKQLNKLQKYYKKKAN